MRGQNGWEAEQPFTMTFVILVTTAYGEPTWGFRSVG